MTLPETLTITIGPQQAVQEPQVVKRELYLVKQDDPVLLTPCKPAVLDFTHREENKTLAECMLKVCEAKNGYGLSANQLGVGIRLFVLNVPHDPQLYTQWDKVYFNPEFLSQAEEFEDMEEGCLSLPFVFQKVKRPKWVILRWQDINGVSKRATFHGITARVVCHEMDHMNGVTLFDHMSNLEKRRARERQSKSLKRAAQQGKSA
jgi:peptide deformylase